MFTRMGWDLPGEVLLTRQQLLQEQDAGRLEEVRLPQRTQTLLNRLQHLAHTQGLRCVQGQGVEDAAERRAYYLGQFSL